MDCHQMNPYTENRHFNIPLRMTKLFIFACTMRQAEIALRIKKIGCCLLVTESWQEIEFFMVGLTSQVITFHNLRMLIVDSR